MQENNKKRRMSNGSKIAITTLSILLVGSLTLGVTGAFFAGNAAVTGDVTLGDPVTISITQGGSSVGSLTFSGAALPGDTYDQIIAVTSPAATSDAVTRAKLTITNNEGAATNVVATVDASWVDGGDDYYYYNGKVPGSSDLNFVTSITIPSTLTNLDANKTYTIDVSVEAIQWANGAAATTWTTAPEPWTTSWGSGV